MLFISAACSESANTKQVPNKTVDILEKNFLMKEVLAIAKAKDDRKSVTEYFGANSERFKHIASQKQGDMNIDGYSVMDISSPIMGYSLFFHKEFDSLVMIDASVNPLNKDVFDNASRLIKEAFDSVSSGGNSKLYFLGIYNMDSKRLLKIMLREEKTSMGVEYAIRYIISSK